MTDQHFAQLAFAFVLLSMVAVLIPFAYREWREKRTDVLMRRGFRAARRFGYLRERK